MYIFKGVRTIKEGDAERNIKIVGYTTSSENNLKTIFNRYSIVILSFSEYKNEILGKLYEVGVEFENVFANIMFVLNNTDGKIRDAFSQFIDTFGITDIIKYIKPENIDLSDEKKVIILNKLLEEFGISNEGGVIENIEIHNKSKKVELTDEKVNELRKDIEDFVKDAKILIEDAKDIDPNGVFELTNLLNDLQKYKKITNIYKIAEVYKKALELYELTYDKYYTHLKNKEIETTSNNIITEIDIVAEYKNYMKVQRAKTLGKVDAKEFGFPKHEILFYSIFGKYGVNLKLLTKEFIKKYKLNYFDINDLFELLQFLLIFLIIGYSIMFLYKSLIGINESTKLGIFLIIFNFSIYGFIVTLGKIIAKKNIIISIIIMITVFIIFYFLKQYITL